MKLFGKIPFSMSLSFWAVAGLIGYFNTNSLIGTFLWIAVIFVSVLVHELGHALVALSLGLNPRIELVAFGGLTHYLKGELSLGKQFLVVVAGPVFGFALFLAAFLLNAAGVLSGYGAQFLILLQFVNLFWTLLNLIPVLPLDGGQILRIAFDVFFRPKGRYYALIVGVCIAGAAALFFFFHQMILLGAFFFLFAYQNGSDALKERHFLPKDSENACQSQFSKAEEALKRGNKEEALAIFEDILRMSPQKGVESLSSQYIAFLEYEKGNKEKVLDILLSKKKALSGESLYLLHKVAFELARYEIVTEISGACFQSFPFKDVCERAAKSHAQQKEIMPCLGWLETSLDLGAEPSLALISDPIFDSIRESEAFSHWTQSHLS